MDQNTILALLNLSSGMSKSMAQNPQAGLASAFGSGMNQASQGQIDEINRQQAIKDQLDLEAEQNARRKDLMTTLLGDQLPNAGGQPVTPGTPKIEPISKQEQLMNVGLKMILSGNPNIMAVGQNLLSVGSALTPKEKWVDSTEVIETPTGTKRLPIQVNSITGEKKYPTYLDKLLSTGTEWDPVSRQYVDKTSRMPVGNRGTGTGTGPEVNNYFAPSGVTADTSLQSPDVSGLTPQEVAGLKVENAKVQLKTNQEKLQAAKDATLPQNLASTVQSVAKADSQINDLKKSIEDFNNSSLPDIPAVKAARIQFGSESGSNISSLANTMFLDRVKEMQQAGVSASQLANSNSEREGIMKTLVDPTAPKATQMAAFERAKQWNENAKEITRKTLENHYKVLGQEVPDVVKSIGKAPESDIVTIKGRQYKKIGDNQYLPL